MPERKTLAIPLANAKSQDERHAVKLTPEQFHVLAGGYIDKDGRLMFSIKPMKLF